MHWSIGGNQASITSASWSWRVELDRPSQGIALDSAWSAGSNSARSWRLMAIHPVPSHACHIDDHFARGADLMVRYGQSEHDQFAFQLDLRGVPANELGGAESGFDIWLSVQTQLLDSHPTLEIDHPGVSSGWSGDRAMQMCATPAGHAGILIHPSDLGQTELLDARSGKLRLFGNFMEKGVIRRGRVRCLVSHQPLSYESLQSAYACFAHSPLPLTT